MEAPENRAPRLTKGAVAALLAFSWTMVLVPIGYGLWQTLLKALLLFGSG